MDNPKKVFPSFLLMLYPVNGGDELKMENRFFQLGE